MPWVAARAPLAADFGPFFDVFRTAAFGDRRSSKFDVRGSFLEKSIGKNLSGRKGEWATGRKREVVPDTPAHSGPRVPPGRLRSTTARTRFPFFTLSLRQLLRGTQGDTILRRRERSEERGAR
jgi:hypothetical protein